MHYSSARKHPISASTAAPTFNPNNFGFIYVSGDDTDHHVAQSQNGGILDGAMETILHTCITSSAISSSSSTKDILAFGVQMRGYGSNECNTWSYNQSTQEYESDAWIAFSRWTSAVSITMGRNITYDIITNATKAATVDFGLYKMLYFPSQKAVAQCSYNYTYTLCDIETALTKRKYDIQVYVNSLRGSIFSLEQTISK